MKDIFHLQIIFVLLIKVLPINTTQSQISISQFPTTGEKA